MKSYRVVWDIQAKQSLKEIIGYLRKSSPTFAKYVKDELLKLIRSLNKMPERFSGEPHLEFRERSVTKWHYKIVYRVKDREREVQVLDIIHTSRDTSVFEEIK